MGVIEPIFLGARARCKNHSGAVLNENEEKCLECRILDRNLSMRPPFQVLCTDSTWGFTKGERYTVQWVIRDASTRTYEKTEGFVFCSKYGNHLEDHIFDADKFIPELYLTEDGKDEWMIGPEQEWEQEPAKVAEFNEQGLENVG